MSKPSSLIAIATVYGDHSQVTDAVAELTGTQPGHVQVFGLAGPNDLVQILANIEGWKLIGTAILSIYGTGIVSEAGKDTWKKFAPRLLSAPTAIKDKYLKLVQALRSEQNRGQDVSIGLIEPTFDGHGRRDRIYILDLSPEEVARHLYIFSNCAPVVAEWLTSVYASQVESYEIQVQMKVSDEGELTVELLPGYMKILPVGPFRRVYNSKGELIREERTE